LNVKLLPGSKDFKITKASQGLPGDDNILVPGAFYAEVGLEASKNLLEMSPFNLELAVEFYRPLRLSPGSPCEAFVILKSFE
jgi:hypothetical protein